MSKCILYVGVAEWTLQINNVKRIQTYCPSCFRAVDQRKSRLGPDLEEHEVKTALARQSRTRQVAPELKKWGIKLLFRQCLSPLERR